MSERLKDEEYKPPAAHICEETTYPIFLDEHHELVVAQSVYKGKVVWFAIMQYYTEGSVRTEIARIDCCHGYVHRHVFGSDGEDLNDGRVIEHIPVGDGSWAFVDTMFAECYERMVNEYLENFRRWSK